MTNQVYLFCLGIYFALSSVKPYTSGSSTESGFITFCQAFLAIPCTLQESQRPIS